MTGEFLNVDIESINTTKSIMENKYNELVDMVNKYKDMVENTQDVYYSDSGTQYRNVAVGYITIINNYLTNDLKPLIDSLDDIKETYVELHSTMKSSVEV